MQAGVLANTEGSKLTPARCCAAVDVDVDVDADMGEPNGSVEAREASALYRRSLFRRLVPLVPGDGSLPVWRCCAGVGVL